MKRYLIEAGVLVLCLALIAPAFLLAVEPGTMGTAALAFPPPKPKPPKPKPPKPPPKWHHHHHHHHLPPPVAGIPWQVVRYVQVTNQTGMTLTVYARIEDSPTWSWTFAPGQTAYLSVDEERLATSEMFLWAKAANRSWTTYRDQALIVVPAPYLSHGLRTYTYTFFP